MSEFHNKRRTLAELCKRPAVIPTSCLPVVRGGKPKRDDCAPGEEEVCFVPRNFTVPFAPPEPPPVAVPPEFFGNTRIEVTCDPSFDGGDPSVVPADTFWMPTQVEADDAATAAALAALRCYWLNDEQVATCDPDEDNIPASVHAANPVTIPAGTQRSYVSKADANSQALLAAQALLECYWLNEEQVATCDPDVDSVPADVSDSNPRTVLAGSIQSSISMSDANAQALAQAQSELDCVWSSQLITVTCDPDGDNVPAAVSDNNPVELDPGYQVSRISRADANAIATSAAQSQLLCVWYNDEKTASCPDGMQPVSALVFDEEEGEVKPDPGFSYPVVAAGSVPSYHSKADANATAQAIADGMIACAVPQIFGGGGGGQGLPGDQGPGGNCETPCSGVYA